MLHFAPEIFMEKEFSNQMTEYYKVDLIMNGVDSRVDMCCLPFSSASFDIVYASHVLEHIKQDLQTINEIKRVLVPGGISILPVPIIGASTIEYSELNPYESNHVLAPDDDCFERYKPCFSHVEVFSSDSFEEKYQLYIYEDRNGYPSEKFPGRVAMKDERHSDYVSVCYA